jgi:uncharacterized cupin superfamily protein
MKKIDRASVPAETDCNYPYPFDVPCSLQSCQRLARHGGLTLFGVNLTVIEPGGWSSQRHWHSHEAIAFCFTTPRATARTSGTAN